MPSHAIFFWCFQALPEQYELLHKDAVRAFRPPTRLHRRCDSNGAEFPLPFPGLLSCDLQIQLAAVVAAVVMRADKCKCNEMIG